MSYTYRNFALGLVIIWSFLARELKKLKIAVLVKDPVFIESQSSSSSKELNEI